jgi:hypothetical protein
METTSSCPDRWSGGGGAQEFFRGLAISFPPYKYIYGTDIDIRVVKKSWPEGERERDLYQGSEPAWGAAPLGAHHSPSFTIHHSIPG